MVREVLTAHTFWHLRGLKVDLVLISEEVPSYDEPLTDHLRRLAEAHAQLTGVDQPGGVFLRSASKISKEELSVHSGRRASGVGRGPRHTSPATGRAGADRLRSRACWCPANKFQEEPSPPLPFMELEYFNGLGGFTPGWKRIRDLSRSRQADSRSLGQHHGESELRHARLRVGRGIHLVR